MLGVWKIEGDRLKEAGGLSELDGTKDIVWIDLFAPTREEDNAVEQCLGISIPTKEDMDEIEASSRVYEENGADYMTMIAVAQMNLDDPVKTPVSFILYKNALVTVRYHELTPFRNYMARTQKPGGVPIAVRIPRRTCWRTDFA